MLPNTEWECHVLSVHELLKIDDILSIFCAALQIPNSARFRRFAFVNLQIITQYYLVRGQFSIII